MGETDCSNSSNIPTLKFALKVRTPAPMINKFSTARAVGIVFIGDNHHAFRNGGDAANRPLCLGWFACLSNRLLLVPGRRNSRGTLRQLKQLDFARLFIVGVLSKLRLLIEVSWAGVELRKTQTNKFADGRSRGILGGRLLTNGAEQGWNNQSLGVCLGFRRPNAGIPAQLG